MPLSSTPTTTLREPSVIFVGLVGLDHLHVPLLGLAGVRATAAAGTLGEVTVPPSSRPSCSPRHPCPRSPTSSGVPSDTGTLRVAPTDRARCRGRLHDVGAEGGPVGVGHDHTDLRPGLHDDAAGLLHGVAHDLGLARVGDLGVEQVAEDDPVGGHDRHGGRRDLGAGGGGAGEQAGTEGGGRSHRESGAPPGCGSGHEGAPRGSRAGCGPGQGVGAATLAGRPTVGPLGDLRVSAAGVSRRRMPDGRHPPSWRGRGTGPA